ncbi:MAG: hypothetical protein IJZ35_05070 [Clostridia bacterium]|nr:hypothetical protein [Clostridia bacterium]
MKIIYKILNSAAVLAFIPVLLFLPMFRFIMTIGMNSSNILMSLLGSAFDINSVITQATGIDFSKLPETYTIPEIYNLLFSENATIGAAGFDISAVPEEIVNYFSAAAILLAVALFFAIVVFFVGLFTKKKLLTASFGALGFVSAFSAAKCFDHIAEQLVSGKLSLTPILEKLEALQDYASYLEYVNIDIRIFELSSAYTMLLVIFGAIVLLNIGFHLADSVSDA